MNLVFLSSSLLVTLSACSQAPSTEGQPKSSVHPFPVKVLTDFRAADPFLNIGEELKVSTVGNDVVISGNNCLNVETESKVVKQDKGFYDSPRVGTEIVGSRGKTSIEFSELSRFARTIAPKKIELNGNTKSCAGKNVVVGYELSGKVGISIDITFSKPELAHELSKRLQNSSWLRRVYFPNFQYLPTQRAFNSLLEREVESVVDSHSEVKVGFGRSSATTFEDFVPLLTKIVFSGSPTMEPESIAELDRRIESEFRAFYNESYVQDLTTSGPRNGVITAIHYVELPPSD